MSLTKELNIIPTMSSLDLPQDTTGTKTGTGTARSHKKFKDIATQLQNIKSFIARLRKDKAVTEVDQQPRNKTDTLIREKEA